MGNVLRVFKRDVLRLLKAPCALVVVIALLVLPSVYTWYNVVGFWNPYDNTGNLRVCVGNEDRRFQRADRRAARGRYDRGGAARKRTA